MLNNTVFDLQLKMQTAPGKPAFTFKGEGNLLSVVPVPAAVVQCQFPDSVKIICEAGTGYNNLDLAAAREKGLVGMEGKEYVVKDGDVILFRFNV